MSEDLEIEIDKLKEENKRLHNIIMSTKESIQYVGHIYSGHRTTHKVEKLLALALNGFGEIRQYIYKQDTKEQKTKEK